MRIAWALFFVFVMLMTVGCVQQPASSPKYVPTYSASTSGGYGGVVTVTIEAPDTPAAGGTGSSGWGGFGGGGPLGGNIPITCSEENGLPGIPCSSVKGTIASKVHPAVKLPVKAVQGKLKPGVCIPGGVNLPIVCAPATGMKVELMANGQQALFTPSVGAVGPYSAVSPTEKGEKVPPIVPTSVTAQVILDFKQAKYPGNEKVKQCGPDNHDGVCFDPKRPHQTHHLYVSQQTCERGEGMDCTDICSYWAPIGKVVFEEEKP